jgi:hypothetical protein
MEPGWRKEVVPQEKYPSRRHCEMAVVSYLRVCDSVFHACLSLERNTHINRQVFPQAPSPTMTSLRRISAMVTARLGCQRMKDNEV